MRLALLLTVLVVAFAPAADDPPAKLLTLFIVGDSTVKNGAKGQQGWGDPVAALAGTRGLQAEGLPVAREEVAARAASFYRSPKAVPIRK